MAKKTKPQPKPEPLPFNQLTAEELHYLRLVIDGRLQDARMRLQRRPHADPDHRRNTAVSDRLELTTLRSLQRKFGPYQPRSLDDVAA